MLVCVGEFNRRHEALKPRQLGGVQGPSARRKRALSETSRKIAQGRYPIGGPAARVGTGYHRLEMCETGCFVAMADFVEG